MALKIEDLSFSFADKVIVNKVSYTFTKGKIYGLLGKNGVGKTTLFNLITGRYKYEGNITLDGRELNTTNIGYLHSIPSVPDFMTAYEYLNYFIKLKDKEIKDKKSIDEYFEMINIPLEERDKLLKDYSHGMKQKLELLVNIIVDNDILLLDEPLTNLDLVACEEFKMLLSKMKKDKIIILSTHILELCTSLCDEIVLLKKQKLTLIDNDKDIILDRLQGEE